jgi:tRNA threonylcarbamoyl adenosine modification protein YeaZ
MNDEKGVLTLVLETSTARGGVALFRERELVFSESFVADRSHSSDLFAVIERALAGGVKPGRIVVGLGPGSYAGVRIGIAAAIGISLATGGELLGIASVAGLEAGEYAALGDARRGSFYFARVREGEMAAGPMLLTREELESRLTEFHGPVFSSEELGMPGVEIRFPQADRIGRLAIEGRGIHARGVLEPIYLREPHITEAGQRNSKFETRNSKRKNRE